MEKVTFVIPVRNESEYITKCLDSIVGQSYAKEFIEVIVVDGNSTDNTVNIVKNYIAKYNNFNILINDKQITPISLNIGVRNSTGDIIIILGGHSYIDKMFVERNVINIENKGLDCSGGVIETINNTFIGEVISLAMTCKFGVGNALFRYSFSARYVETVAFGAYKRNVFERIGYFDEELVRNQDYEFNLRLSRSGGKIYLDPQIKSYYYSRASIKRLWKQYNQYGFWKVKVLKKHKIFTAYRHFVPPIFVLSILSLGVGACFSSLLKTLLACELSIYFLSSIYFSFKIALSKKLKYFFTLPFIFLVLHLSYGIGFLEGVISFIILGEKLNLKNRKLNN